MSSDGVGVRDTPASASDAASRCRGMGEATLDPSSPPRTGYVPGALREGVPSADMLLSGVLRPEMGVPGVPGGNGRTRGLYGVAIGGGGGSVAPVTGAPPGPTGGPGV